MELLRRHLPRRRQAIVISRFIHADYPRGLDLLAELITIDENLIRNELSPARRAEQVSRRKEIYEALHPETRHGGDRRASRHDGDLKPQAFTKATAEATGRSERTVQREAERRLLQEASDIEAEIKQFFKDAGPERFASVRGEFDKADRALIASVPTVSDVEQGRRLYRGEEFEPQDLADAEKMRPFFPSGERYDIVQIAWTLRRIRAGEAHL